MTSVAEPPFLLDSARVVMYAITGGAASYTGRITVHVGGDRLLDPVPRVAICEDLVGGQFLLMHCDDSWKVLAAGFSKSVADAQHIAERAYTGVSANWVPFRALSPAELAQVEEQRTHLRQLAKEIPNDSGGPHAV
jgi:hypothetical protein